MPTVVRPVTFTNTLQRLVVDNTTAGDISVELWGGGGGGGGNDSGAGGSGSGAGYSRVSFTAQVGDTIDIAIGGAGGGGASYAGSAPGGSAGPSYIVPTQVFNSLQPPAGQPAVYQVTNRNYCGFLNTYGVWNEPGGYSSIFDRTYTINVATAGSYQVVSSCDNYGTVEIDGSVVLSVGGYTSTYTTTVYLSVGAHVIRTYGVNTGGPGSMATTVSLGSGASSYSGAFGGAAGPAGSSGGGGGGGGATVLFKNGTLLAVAGGGGGGGGGGNQGARDGQNAPGTQGTSGTAGQNGSSYAGDGGGGGGGGGGNGGGNGGPIGNGYDTGGLAGSTGGNFGTTTVIPNGRNPGVSTIYGTPGVGGTRTSAGTPGLAVFTFNINGMYVKSGGDWRTVQQTYIKDGGEWKLVQDTWIKRNGVWVPIPGNNNVAPVFSSVSGNFGVNPRIYPPPEPDPDPPSFI